MAGPSVTPNDAVAAVAGLLAEAGETPSSDIEAVEDFGWYEGLPVRVSFDENGRSAHVLAPVTYHERGGSSWHVPSGAWCDGASIPRAFWTLVGGPFEGKYREASVVHDHYCITRDRTWQATHHMFHDAVRCRGVGRVQAAVMFYAVYRFGPRWPASGTAGSLEIVDTGAPAERLDATTAESFLRDCEAIVQHDLDPPAIATLAEVRAAQFAASPEGLEEPAALPGRAQLVVVPGGSGKAEDVAAVASGAGRLPDWMIDHFLSRRIRIIACRGSVADFEKSLKGKTPRGWEGLGRTWDSVPGTYLDGKRRVVIATIDKAGARVIPDKTSGMHGSDDLVVHESLHGYDYSTSHAVLAAPSFRAARDQDVAVLPDYEKQAGQAGLEETFAESGAQFLRNRAAMAAALPGLAAFWSTMPLTDEARSILVPQVDAREPLGVASRRPDGSLVIDLRATDDAGAIGHASLTLAPQDPGHAVLVARLFPSSSLESLESGSREVLFYGGAAGREEDHSQSD